MLFNKVMLKVTEEMLGSIPSFKEMEYVDECLDILYGANNEDNYYLMISKKVIVEIVIRGMLEENLSFEDALQLKQENIKESLAAFESVAHELKSIKNNENIKDMIELSKWGWDERIKLIGTGVYYTYIPYSVYEKGTISKDDISFISKLSTNTDIREKIDEHYINFFYEDIGRQVFKLNNVKTMVLLASQTFWRGMESQRKKYYQFIVFEHVLSMAIQKAFEDDTNISTAFLLMHIEPDVMLDDIHKTAQKLQDNLGSKKVFVDNLFKR